MTSAVHSALPKTERHAPSTAHGGKSTKTATDFQRLLHGGTENRRAGVKSDDTEARPDNAVASGDHDPVRAKFDEKAATSDSPADLTSEADLDQRQQQATVAQDGRSALDVLSSLISLNAADPSVRRPAADTETSRGESATPNESVTASDREINQPILESIQKPSPNKTATATPDSHIVQEGAKLVAGNSKPAAPVSVESQTVARETPANDNPKVTLPAEHPVNDPASQIDDHRTSQVAGEAHSSGQPKASADATASAPKPITLAAEEAFNTRPFLHAEQPQTVDARISVTENRQYVAPATTAALLAVDPATQQSSTIAATPPATSAQATAQTTAASAPTAAKIIEPSLSANATEPVATLAVSNEMPGPTVRSETREQPVSAQRTARAGGGTKLEPAVPSAHTPTKASTTEAIRTAVPEPSAAKPEPVKSIVGSDAAFASPPAVGSEVRAQPVSAQRRDPAGGSAKSESAVPPAHIPDKPSPAETIRIAAPEQSTAKAETERSIADSNSALVLTSTAQGDWQSSDPSAPVREQPKIETLPARNDTASGINATVVPPQMTVTTAETLATSIADGLSEKKPLAAAANMPVLAAPQHQSAHVLKIELHPAELGAVTANLKVAGEQLSIEIQVENHEAYRRLSSDSDDLANTLRKLGYDVDRITILQPQTAATPTSRTEAQTSSTHTSSRDQSAAFSSSGQGGNGSGGDGQRSGRNPSHDAYASRDPASPRRDDGRGGIVI